MFFNESGTELTGSILKTLPVSALLPPGANLKYGIAKELLKRSIGEAGKPHSCFGPAAATIGLDVAVGFYTCVLDATLWTVEWEHGVRE